MRPQGTASRFAKKVRRSSHRFRKLGAGLAGMRRSLGRSGDQHRGREGFGVAPLVSNKAPWGDCHWETSAKMRLGPDKKINTFLNTTFLRSGSVAPPVPLSALPCRMVRTAIGCPGAARPVGQAVWRAFAHHGSAPRTDGRDRPRVGSGMVPGQVAEGLRPLDVGRPRTATVGSGVRG